MENEIEISDSKKAFEIANLETNLAELRSVIGRACICCAGCPYADLCDDQPRTTETPSANIEDVGCDEIFVTDDFFSTAKIINQIENIRIDDTSHSNETPQISEDEIVKKEIIKSQKTTKKNIEITHANITSKEIQNTHKPKSKINSLQHGKIDETIQTVTRNYVEIKKPITKKYEEIISFKVPKANSSQQDSNILESSESCPEPPKLEIIVPIRIEEKPPKLETTFESKNPELPKIITNQPNDVFIKIESISQEIQIPSQPEENTIQEDTEITEYINGQNQNYAIKKPKSKSEQEVQTTTVEKSKNIHNKKPLRITHVAHSGKKQSASIEFRADLIFEIARLAISKISVSHLDYSLSSRYNSY